MDLRIFKDKRLSLIIVSSFAWGILAHGMMLFNKYSYHDDVIWVDGFNYSDTYGLGRWGRAALGNLALFLFGGKHSSTPAFLGLLTIACIALMLFLVVKRLGIENRIMIISLAGVMVCFPAVTGIFGFMFLAPYFFFGSLLGVIGAYIYYSEKKLSTFIACTVLMAVSTAIYQANIPIDLMVLLLFMMDDVVRSDMSWKDYFMLGLKNALICVAFMAEYLISNEIALKIVGMKMSDYKGVGSYGVTGVSDYIHRVFTAYKRFIKPADFIGKQGVSANMFPWTLKYYHWILVIVSVVLIVLMIRSLGKIRRMAEILIIIAIAPLFAYFIYIMVDQPEIHGLMTYGEVFLFFIPVYILSYLPDGDKLKKYLGIATAALIMMTSIVSARFANVCYLKAEVLQAEAVSYFNRLITRIQETPGYTDETPVYYAGAGKKNDDEFMGEKAFDPIYLPPYHRNSILNDYAWEDTMELWCGFSPVKAADGSIADKETLAKMPCYPEAGSVKMIDDILVVKFSD